MTIITDFIQKKDSELNINNTKLNNNKIISSTIECLEFKNVSSLLFDSNVIINSRYENGNIMFNINTTNINNSLETDGIFTINTTLFSSSLNYSNENNSLLLVNNNLSSAVFISSELSINSFYFTPTSIDSDKYVTVRLTPSISNAGWPTNLDSNDTLIFDGNITIHSMGNSFIRFKNNRNAGGGDDAQGMLTFYSSSNLIFKPTVLLATGNAVNTAGGSTEIIFAISSQVDDGSSNLNNNPCGVLKIAKTDNSGNNFDNFNSHLNIDYRPLWAMTRKNIDNYYSMLYKDGAFRINYTNSNTVFKVPSKNNSNLTSNVTTIRKGSMYYDTGTNKLKVFNGTVWKNISLS